DVDPVTHQAVDLCEERVRIEYHSVADGAAHSRMENAAGDLVQNERPFADVHCVAGVRTALIAHDPIRPSGEHVHQLSFALVAPLCADDDERAGLRAEHDEESSS